MTPSASRTSAGGGWGRSVMAMVGLGEREMKRSVLIRRV